MVRSFIVAKQYGFFIETSENNVYSSIIVEVAYREPPGTLTCSEICAARELAASRSTTTGRSVREVVIGSSPEVAIFDSPLWT